MKVTDCCKNAYIYWDLISTCEYINLESLCSDLNIDIDHPPRDGFLYLWIWQIWQILLSRKPRMHKQPYVLSLNEWNITRFSCSCLSHLNVTSWSIVTLHSVVPGRTAYIIGSIQIEPWGILKQKLWKAMEVSLLDLRILSELNTKSQIFRKGLVKRFKFQVNPKGNSPILW